MALRLAGALTWFWLIRGYWNEARTWFERSLENCSVSPARALVLVALGVMEYFVGKELKCEALFEEGIALYRQQGDQRGVAFAASLLGTAMSDPARARALFDEARSIAQELNDEWLAARTDIGEGMYATNQDNLSLATSLYESALVHARRAGDRWFIRNALGFLGAVALEQGDTERAETLLTESLEVSRELGNKNGVALQLLNLGKNALGRNDCRRASALIHQALLLRREMGNTRGILECLREFGKVAAAEQRYERAARLLGAAEPLWEMLNERGRRMYEDEDRTIRAQSDEVASEKARAEGRAMSLEQAIEYALENPDSTVIASREAAKQSPSN
jgi:tetratricopeptide (TPR) repeat protein